MKKAALINHLFKLEESIINGDISRLALNQDFENDCWVVHKCAKKRCPAYGRRNVRCWHVIGTFCVPDQKNLNIFQKWEDCRECQVFKKATQTEDDRIKELFNNILYFLSALDVETVLKIKKIKTHFPKIVKKNNITTRESEVLLLLLTRSNRTEISNHLNLSIETVKMHIKSLYKKLNVHSKNELFRKLEKVK